MFPFLLYTRQIQAEQSFLTLSWPGQGRVSRVPSSDYQLRLDPEGLLLGPVGQKLKGHSFHKIVEEMINLFPLILSAL